DAAHRLADQDVIVDDENLHAGYVSRIKLHRVYFRTRTKACPLNQDWRWNSLIFPVINEIQPHDTPCVLAGLADSRTTCPLANSSLTIGSGSLPRELRADFNRICRTKVKEGGRHAEPNLCLRRVVGPVPRRTGRRRGPILQIGR